MLPGASDKKNMPFNKSIKQTIIEKFKRESGDTGSPEVQVALLSSQISSVTEHLGKHVKDDHTRRGLVKMVSKRKRLLNYLKTKSESRHKTLTKALGL